MYYVSHERDGYFNKIGFFASFYVRATASIYLILIILTSLIVLIININAWWSGISLLIAVILLFHSWYLSSKRKI